jgi:hypothetical protein
MILLGKIALGMTGMVFAGVGVLCSEGFVQVKVIQKQADGHHINVIAPAVLGPVAAHFVPQSKLEDASLKLRPWLPVVDATLDGLRETDDVVLVDVTEPDEHVTVRKSGGSIVVDVDDPNETVHVSAPLRAISGTVDQIGEAPNRQ